MTGISRRAFIKVAGLSAAKLTLLKNITLADSSTSDPLEIRAKKKANQFVNSISRNPFRDIKSITLFYEVHMMADLYVKLKMNAVLKFIKRENNYFSTFSLTKPEGEGGWSWLVFNLFGKHTAEYKEMMKNIEIRLMEFIHLWENKLYTNKLEEIQSKTSENANQPAMKIDFDYDEMRIKFWGDKSMSKHDKTIKYTNQIAPLTAFFNYIFFDTYQTNIKLINALKQVENKLNNPSPISIIPNFLFESQLVRIGKNMTGEFSEFPMTLHFEKGNFLDVIYGDYIFYKLVHNKASNIKVPYSAQIEGIISKKRKRGKLKELKKRYPHKTSFEKELRDEYKDILASTDVRVYLSEFEIIR
ncbi:MAG: hypothetical protein JRJ27_03745 [Deltaproteobacteria bacterium]|nr:hypothetical protein [Deltaproteobacteria bacterium]